MRSKQIGPMLDLCFLRGGQYPKIGIPRVNIQDVEKAFLVLPGMMFYKWWGGNPHPSELKLGGNSLQRSFHR